VPRPPGLKPKRSRRKVIARPLAAGPGARQDRALAASPAA